MTSFLSSLSTQHCYLQNPPCPADGKTQSLKLANKRATRPLGHHSVQAAPTALPRNPQVPQQEVHFSESSTSLTPIMHLENRQGPPVVTNPHLHFPQASHGPPGYTGHMHRTGTILGTGPGSPHAWFSVSSSLCDSQNHPYFISASNRDSHLNLGLLMQFSMPSYVLSSGCVWSQTLGLKDKSFGSHFGALAMVREQCLATQLNSVAQVH